MSKDLRDADDSSVLNVHVADLQTFRPFLVLTVFGCHLVWTVRWYVMWIL